MAATFAKLPIEKPTEFEFVLNLKTAKLLGVKVPPFIQFGADDCCSPPPRESFRV
jgi:putative ABC transport system substrate-binding protein